MARRVDRPMATTTVRDPAAIHREGAPEPKTQSARARVGPTARILITFAAGIGLTTSILYLAHFRAESAASSAESMSGQLGPAQEALLTAASAAAQSQGAFLVALQSTGAQQMSALATAQTSAQAADVAWSSYLRDSLNRPAERTLQRDFASANATSRQLGARLVAMSKTSPTFDTLLKEEVRASNRSAHDLSDLEGIYGTLLKSTSASIVRAVAAAKTPFNAVVLAIGALFVLITGFFVVASRRERTVMSADTDRLNLVVGEIEFESSLQRGLEMAGSEEAVFTVAGRAVEVLARGDSAQFILTDTGHGHFRDVIAVNGGDGESGCDVAVPEECPAMQSGQVRVFPDSTRLDRCPHLAERPAPTCAICVPVNIAGSIRGVLHVERPAAGGIPERLEHGMMVIGRRLAERLGALQVLARTQYRAETDPLTGLSNRTTFETLKERLAGSDARYVVAFADLDHFKAVNDEYGHETGDRALRLFARVLRDAVRPEDLVARYGGEEFVVVLPECSISDARLVGKRIRDTLAKAVVDTGLPVFTVTIGLAAAEPGEAFAKVVSRADAAMLRGKQLGRNHLLAFEELAIPQDPDTSADPTAAEPLGSERAAPPAA